MNAKSILSIMIQARDQASGVLKGVGGAVDEVRSKASKLSKDGFESIKTSSRNMVLALGAASLAIGAYGLNIAQNYEQQLSSISALTGASRDQMKQVSDLAMDLGSKTKYSALEAAAGAEELLKAGVSLEQVMGGGLAGALDLAAAGGLDVAEAAEIASTALNAFSKDGLTVSKTADILAGAANASATSVQELKFGLSMSAAVASGVGLTFKETSTALAIFAQNGLKGSDAGTSLKTMLMNLQPATKKQQQLWDQLGLSFYDSQGKIKPLTEIAGQLKDKFADMTDAQRALAFETAFGSDAIRAANILYKEGAEGVGKMTSEMLKFTAADVAKEKTNNLAGAIERFRGALDTKTIQLFMTPIPGLTKAIDLLGSTIDSIDIPYIIDQITQKLESLKVQVLNVYRDIQASPIYDEFMKIWDQIDKLEAGKAVIAGIAGTILVTLVPALAILAANAVIAAAPFVIIGSVIAGLYYIWNTNFLGIQDVTKQTIETVRQFADSVGITDALNGDFTKLKDTITGVKDTVVSLYDQGLKVVTDFINQNMQPELAVFNAAMELLKTVWDQLVMAFQFAMPALIVIGGVLWWVASNVITALIWAFNTLRPPIMALIQAVLELAKPLIEILWPIILLIIGVLGTLIGIILVVLMPVFQILWAVVVQAFTGILQIITGVIQIITGILNVFVGIIKGIFTGDFSQAVKGLQQIFNGFVTFLWGFINLVTSPVMGMVNGIINSFKSVNLWQMGVDMMQGLINGIKNMAGSVGDAVKNTVSGAVDGAKSFLKIKSPSQKMRDEVGRQIPAGAAAGIKAGQKDLEKTTANVFNNVVPTARRSASSADGSFPEDGGDLTGGQVQQTVINIEKIEVGPTLGTQRDKRMIAAEIIDEIIIEFDKRKPQPA